MIVSTNNKVATDDCYGKPIDRWFTVTAVL